MSAASLSEPSLTAARAGSEAAFDALIGPLVEPAYKLAFVILRDPNEAQDAVQEACFRAWKKLHQLRAGSPVRPWFLAIVANYCRTLRRRGWWSQIRVASVDKQVDFPEELDSGLDLNSAVGKLPITDRTVLFLFFYLDLPLAEVSRVLGISPHAAKSRVHRAVVRLRNMVEVAE